MTKQDRSTLPILHLLLFQMPKDVWAFVKCFFGWHSWPKDCAYYDPSLRGVFVGGLCKFCGEMHEGRLLHDLSLGHSQRCPFRQGDMIEGFEYQGTLEELEGSLHQRDQI